MVVNIVGGGGGPPPSLLTPTSPDNVMIYTFFYVCAPYQKIQKIYKLTKASACQRGDITSADKRPNFMTKIISMSRT